MKIVFLSIFILLITFQVGICYSKFDGRSVKKAAGERVKLNRRSPLSKMFPAHYPPMIRNGIDAGQPLFLSPLIKAGKISEAQQASEVTILGVKGYTGFITVNETCNANTFFWYFPALNNPDKAPLLMWLQGGPGGSSMFGLFVEHGPFVIDKDGNAHLRNITWISKYSVVYVDNPIGTGFSFTDNDACFARNESDVGRDLYNFLQQFYQLYPALENVPFYPAGESYAGKYVPAIAYKIHVENSDLTNDKVKIPMVGMIIGDGFTDPVAMMPEYAPLLFQIGLLDENQRDHFGSMIAESINLAKQSNFVQAFKLFDKALNGDIYPYHSYFTNCTGGTNYFNYLQTDAPEEYDYFGNYLANPDIRNQIHVGNLTFHNGTEVEAHMVEDIMQGVSRWVEKLLDAGYRTLFFNGNLDIIVGTTLTERLLWSTIQWEHSEDYRKAPRSIWKVRPDDKEVAGYVRCAANLCQVAVRGAGHILPYDQPERGFDLIDRFITGKLWGTRPAQQLA